MLQLRMQRLLGSAQSDPEMLSTLVQLLGGQAGTSGREGGAAAEDQQSTLAAAENTEDFQSNEGGEASSGPESGAAPASAEEEQQSAYLRLGARPKTRQDRK